MTDEALNPTTTTNVSGTPTTPNLGLINVTDNVATTSKLTDNNYIQDYTDIATTSSAADNATSYKIGAVSNSSHGEYRPLFRVGDTVTIINPVEIASTSYASDIASISNVGDDSIAYDGDIGSASSDDDRPLICYNNHGRNVANNDDTVIVITTSDGAMDMNINEGDIAVVADDGNMAVPNVESASTSSANIM